MPSKELKQYFKELGRVLMSPGDRPAKGALLKEAFEIPLIWPEREYPTTRSMPEQFQQALRPWNGIVHFVETEDNVLPTVAKIIQGEDAARDGKTKKIARWECERLAMWNWEEGLAHLNIEWTAPSAGEMKKAATDNDAREAVKALYESVDVGITDADYAIAHTGTLVFFHDAERHAFMNLCPWTHIAIVRTSQMLRTVQDFYDKFARDIEAQPLTSNMTFITGPSRSGDIDLTYGQGAAGPGEYHVILIDDTAADANA